MQARNEFFFIFFQTASSPVCTQASIERSPLKQGACEHVAIAAGKWYNVRAIANESNILMEKT